VANAAIIATPRTAAKIAKVICVRRRLLQLGSLFMDNTLSNINQRNCVGPVPPSTRLGTGSRPVIEENILPIRAWLITMQPASA